METLDKFYSDVDSVLDKINFPESIPFDGAVITLATVFLSPPGYRIRNTVVIGGLHGLFHHFAHEREHGKYKNQETF